MYGEGSGQSSYQISATNLSRDLYVAKLCQNPPRIHVCVVHPTSFEKSLWKKAKSASKEIQMKDKIIEMEELAILSSKGRSDGP